MVRRTARPTGRLGYTLSLALLAGACADEGVQVEPVSTLEEAPALRYGTAEEAGMSQAVLDEALAVYRDAVDEGELVGAVVLVARHGTVVVHEAIGMSDLAEGIAMAPNTLFQMASNTKPAVASAVGIMAEAGELDPDAEVRAYLPEWDNDQAGSISLAQLLSHTSGLRISSLFLPGMEEGTDLVLEARRFGEVGAAAEPGEYSYNNPGFNTLGALLELRSGEELEEHLDRVLYTPLGMDDSYNYRANHPLGGKRDRLGPMYYERDDDGEWIAGQAYTIPFARASGGMISTAWDYAVFLQAMLNGGAYGDVRVLSEEMVALMTRDHVEGPEGYGFGWSVPDGYGGWGSGPGHFGHSGSDGTDAFADPETGVLGLVFTQTPSGRPPFSEFRERVKGAIEPRG